MTYQKALYNFFSSFGLTAYPKENVPDDVTFPWLTFENNTADSGEETSLAVDIWFHTESETQPNQKAQEISEAIGRGGKLLTFDGGAVWLKRGNPWITSLQDEADATIKRRQLIIMAEFITE